jgi:hypothetical protein
VQQEEWRAHNLLALAWCLADSGNKERAVAVAQECEKLAKGGELLAAAAALRVHLTVSGKSGVGSGKAKGDLRKDAEGQARYGGYLRPSSTFSSERISVQQRKLQLAGFRVI